MLKRGSNAIAVVPGNLVVAPFYGVGEDVQCRLMNMGVMKENHELVVETIEAMANAFASNFYDGILEAGMTDPNTKENICECMEGFYHLYDNADITGLYYYTLLSCGMYECQMPLELMWISRVEEALDIYMDQFVSAVRKYTEVRGIMCQSQL